MVFFLLLLIGAWILWKRTTDGLLKYDLLIAWAIKLAAGWLFLVVYSEYYGSGTLTADPRAFMRESALLNHVAHESFTDYLRFLAGMETQPMIDHYLSATTHWSSGDLTLFNDSKNVIRVNSLLYFLSNGNVYLHILVFGFLSLLGFRELYLTFTKVVSFPKRRFWYALILLPSLVFWTGSMLKEPLMIVGLCLVIRAWFGELGNASRIWRWVIGLLLLTAFKPYVLLCLLPAIILYVLTVKVFKNRIWLAFSVMFAVFMAIITFLPAPREKGVFYLTRKQFDFVNIGKGGIHAYADSCFYFFRPDQFKYLNITKDDSVFLTRPLHAKKVALGKALPFEDVTLMPNKKAWFMYFRSNGCTSYVPVTPIGSSSAQLVCNIPEALTNAAFRPFFGDPGGWLKYFAVVETIVLFGWVLYAFSFWKSATKQTRIQVVSLLLFAVCLLLLIGWITPVLGAMVRYRIPAYLAIFVAAALLFRKTKPTETWEKLPS
ncbi:MAG: hypothetical protein V4604_07330 [Bacteroidota bacterium]